MVWYKDAVVYEVNVRAFADQDGDGVGDFRGLARRLDYLRDLGVSALWLLPFYPSPMRDDGYDISDYTSVHPVYGTLEDFKAFLGEAHRRGLKVITELVLNHTSDQHPWFQRARRAPAGDPARDLYVWSDRPDRYREARVIFKDFEASNWTWDPIARAYFWHRFYSHQPDLNYDNLEARRRMMDVVDFWLDLGVDGLRLDAVPYLFEKDGTNCENLPETHAFLKELRRHVDARFSGRMLLAEANQWPEDAAAYFGSGEGDECHAAFHFPLMPRMFMALQTEDRFPIVDILEQTPALPPAGQWGLFLRNHDELTLEMVTDEERDYMYRMYADDPQARINLGIRRRLAPLLGNDRRKIELMNGLLFSLPGTPFIYYGDEIGMGDNFYLGDRNGVRTPMQWSSDRNAGFSQANSQRLYLPVIIDPEYHYEAVNVDVQQNNPHSLLWWLKRLIAQRKRSKVFGRGTLEMLYPDNRKVLAFVRRHEGETLLVVANLSRFVQHVELDLRGFDGLAPVEVLGRSEFPAITARPYSLTLGPHDFYWFELQPTPSGTAEREPSLAVEGSWTEVFSAPALAALEEALSSHLRRAAAARITDLFTLSERVRLAFVVMDSVGGDALSFVVPIAWRRGEFAAETRRRHADAAIASLRAGGEEGLLCDAVADAEFCRAVLGLAAQSARVRGTLGEIVGSSMESRRRDLETCAPFEPAGVWAAGDNAALSCGKFVLRLLRRLEPGVSPDLDVGRFLTERTSFSHVLPLIGAVEHLAGRGEPRTIATIYEAVPVEGDAWRYALDALASYFERAVTRRSSDGVPGPGLPRAGRLELASAPLPAEAYEAIGPFLREAELLGRRTAELHEALGSASDDPHFAPEPFAWHYQRSLYQSLRTQIRQVAAVLRARLPSLPAVERVEAERWLSREEPELARLRAVHGRRIEAQRLRCHGDYGLDRLLFTGKDFIVTGFEGDQSLPLAERRAKRSPLFDVACLLRSFHYAVFTALLGREAVGVVRPEDRAALGEWARYWEAWVGAGFLRAYLERAAGAAFLPRSRDDLDLLLEVCLVQKAARDLDRELRQGPDAVPLGLKVFSRFLEPAVLARRAL